MNTDIQIFNHPDFGQVRTAGTPEQPLFCLADVCNALELQTRDAKRRLDDGVVTIHPIQDSLGREQLANFITEDGLYDVILDSRKPSAKKFRRWVVSEVLPAIRRTGGYIVETPQLSDEEIMARALNIANDTIARRDQRIRQLEAENEQQRQEIVAKHQELITTEVELQIQTNRAAYLSTILASDSTYTTTQVANSLGMTVAALTSILVKRGIIYRQSGQWLLYSPYSSYGLHAVRTYTFVRDNGDIATNYYTVWTERGRMYIFNLLRQQQMQMQLT